MPSPPTPAFSDPSLDDGAPIVDVAPLDDPTWCVRSPRQRTSDLRPAQCTHRAGTGPCRLIWQVAGWTDANTPPGGVRMPTCGSCNNVRVEPSTWGGLCKWFVDNVGAPPLLCVTCAGAVDRCTSCGHVRAAETDTGCDCFTPEGAGAYHSGRTGDPVIAQINTSGASVADDGDPLIGFEIEIMPHDPGRHSIAPGAHTHRDPIGALRRACGPWIASVESDASLQGRGVEIVTRPLPLSVWRMVLPDLMGAISRIGTATHRACGGHMHVTATWGVVLGARVISASYGNSVQLPVWSAVSGRDPEYTQPPPTFPVIAPDLQPSHGASIGWGVSSRTIEWRHPGGTDDPRVLLGRTELLIDVLTHAQAHHAAHPHTAWGWGLYLRDRPTPTPETIYAFALLHSLGY
jgi:hypothetical protein